MHYVSSITKQKQISNRLQEEHEACCSLALLLKTSCCCQSSSTSEATILGNEQVRSRLTSGKSNLPVCRPITIVAFASLRISAEWQSLFGWLKIFIESIRVRDAFFWTFWGFIRFKRFKRLKLCFKRIIAYYNFLK